MLYSMQSKLLIRGQKKFFLTYMSDVIITFTLTIYLLLILLILTLLMQFLLLFLFNLKTTVRVF